MDIDNKFEKQRKRNILYGFISLNLVIFCYVIAIFLR